MTDLSINVTDSVVPELDVRVLAERLATRLGGRLAKSGDYARVPFAEEVDAPGVTQ
jgi:hypothetical protein